MKFGISLPFVGKYATAENIIRVAQAADEFGYYFVSAGEHMLYPKEIKVPSRYGRSMPIDVLDPHIEIFTCLTWAAAHTSRVKLRTGVVVLPLRSPFVTARMAASLDYLSQGRLILGVGIGWMREEYDVLRVPWAERGALTDEYIRVIRALCGDAPSFEGRYFHFDAVDFEPKPVQRPLPIWVGGTTKHAVRRAARLGDGWIPTTLFPDEVAKLGELLRQTLAEEGRKDELHVTGELFVQFGRQPEDITDRRVMIVPNNREQVLEAVRSWQLAGAHSLYLKLGDFPRLAPEVMIERMQWFAEEVMPEAGRVATI